MGGESRISAIEAAREGWRLDHPAQNGSKGCAGAATRIIQRDYRGFCPGFFCPGFGETDSFGQFSGKPGVRNKEK
jgi:hypothetical protein